MRDRASTNSSTWASCGAMHLTGDPGGPPLSIPWNAGERLDSLAARFGLDTGLLCERAAIMSLSRQGQLSCGGSTRLLRARDGWVAMSLARREDFELLPAFLGVEVCDIDETWGKLVPETEARLVAELEEDACLLGLCLSGVGRTTAGPLTASGTPRCGTPGFSDPLVVDLSALWAGPLCSHLLQRCGARVVKVEDPARPDGARTGSTAFYDLLNECKDSVDLDLRSLAGRSALVDLMESADVIVTSSRERAFEQMGIRVEEVLSSTSDKVWTAVTAYGWSSNRVGFGDDVAASAGLVAWHPSNGEPRFAGDAIADPLCGLEAASLTLNCLSQGGRWFVDASLAGAAVKVEPEPLPANMASHEDGRWLVDGQPVEEPRPRLARSRAHPLGADTQKVLADLKG